MTDTILTESSFFHEPSLQLKVVKRDPELPFRLHSHEFNELVLVIAGTGLHFTKDEEYQLREGSVCFIPIGMQHGYKDIEGLALYNILIGENMLAKNFLDLSELPGFNSMFMTSGQIPTLLLNPTQLSETLPILEMMEKEADDQSFGSGSKTLAYSCLLNLIITLSRIYDETPRENNQRAHRLWDVIAFMDRNKHRSLSSEELTEIAHMSTSTLNRYFKLATGLSPLEFHTHKRIAYACTLIQKRGLSIAEIAQATGFSDPNYFSRQFRKIMDTTPKEYQKIFTNRLS
ncbi:AraC family transcriptional regulator [Sphaerochaeta sp. PS]|uniref:AraC family transcriptional regulator n=1 Tax=Sphaerochaeta sp. PS TaxID=3076336 RepID=UPI0028A3DFBA|nr:AraC family transcriptional regulator [Sphaerochaeta sp. PS]MDT4762240.1 AraC family transcriptional regulator [Sphaerochaeta sp. PS]